MEVDIREFSTPAKAAVVGLFALAGWAICGAIMGIGPLFWSMQTTLIVHAVGGPLAFAALALIYHRWFGFTTPLQTAAIFLGVVIALDLFLVAPVFVGDFAMFASVLGTWIPFAGIFLATWLVSSVAIGVGPRAQTL